MSSSPRFLAPLLALSLALVLVSFSGCNAVYVAQPVGDRPHGLKPEDWNGIWQGDDNSTATVLVTNPEKGELQIGSIEVDKNTLVLKTESIWVRESGPSLFVNILSTHEGKTRYSWASIKRNDDVIVVWSPALEKVRTLVRSGKIKGVATENGDVILETLSAETLSAMVGGDLHAAIDWESPVMLRRVKK